MALTDVSRFLFLLFPLWFPAFCVNVLLSEEQKIYKKAKRKDVQSPPHLFFFFPPFRYAFFPHRMRRRGDKWSRSENASPSLFFFFLPFFVPRPFFSLVSPKERDEQLPGIPHCTIRTPPPPPPCSRPPLPFLYAKRYRAGKQASSFEKTLRCQFPLPPPFPPFLLFLASSPFYRKGMSR